MSCSHCGCDNTAAENEAEHARLHAAGIAHGHSHLSHHKHSDDSHSHEAPDIESARFIRKWFQDHRILFVNLLSPPGAGKTTLIAQTVRQLGRKAWVLCGPHSSPADIDQLRRSGAQTSLLQRGRPCHVAARQVRDTLEARKDADIHIAILDNVGNSSCPAEFDLGEAFKVAILPVTAGSGHPEKYPGIFSAAPVTVITRIDLLPGGSSALPGYLDALRKVRPGVFVFPVSTQTGEGVSDWIDYIGNLLPRP